MAELLSWECDFVKILIFTVMPYTRRQVIWGEGILYPQLELSTLFYIVVSFCIFSCAAGIRVSLGQEVTHLFTKLARWEAERESSLNNEIGSQEAAESHNWALLGV